jgi:hypothetical protein
MIRVYILLDLSILVFLNGCSIQSDEDYSKCWNVKSGLFYDTIQLNGQSQQYYPPIAVSMKCPGKTMKIIWNSDDIKSYFAPHSDPNGEKSIFFESTIRGRLKFEDNEMKLYAHDVLHFHLLKGEKAEYICNAYFSDSSDEIKNDMKSYCKFQGS